MPISIAPPLCLYDTFNIITTPLILYASNASNSLPPRSPRDPVGRAPAR